MHKTHHVGWYEEATSPGSRWPRVAVPTLVLIDQSCYLPEERALKGRVMDSLPLSNYPVGADGTTLREGLMRFGSRFERENRHKEPATRKGAGDENGERKRTSSEVQEGVR